MGKRLFDSIAPSLSEYAQTTTSGSVDVTEVDSWCIIGVFTVSTPSAKSFAPGDVNVTDNTITEAAHGFKTGLKGQFTNAGGALPDGLSPATDYYVIVVDANTYKVASSLNNANAGTAVDLIDQGTGTHTFTPTALAGANAKIQISNDGSNWVDLASSSQNITTTVTLYWVADHPPYNHVRVVGTLTAGQISPTLTYAAKE